MTTASAMRVPQRNCSGALPRNRFAPPRQSDRRTDPANDKGPLRRDQVRTGVQADHRRADRVGEVQPVPESGLIPGRQRCSSVDQLRQRILADQVQHRCCASPTRSRRPWFFPVIADGPPDSTTSHAVAIDRMVGHRTRNARRASCAPGGWSRVKSATTRWRSSSLLADEGGCLRPDREVPLRFVQPIEADRCGRTTGAPSTGARNAFRASEWVMNQR